MTRPLLNRQAFAGLAALLLLTAQVSATTVCVPTEEDEFIEDIGGGSVGGGGDGHESECADSPPRPPDPSGHPQVVAHLGPSQGGRTLIAIDTTSRDPRGSAIQWLAQAVASAPESPPQVIDIGLRQSSEGSTLVVRGGDGRTVFGNGTLPLIGGSHSLLALTVSVRAGHPVLLIGAPGAASLEWRLVQGASITILGARSTGSEPTVLSLDDAVR
jgi:hypothetical protein